MDERLHKQLIIDIDALRKLVGQCSTETVAGTISVQLFLWPDEDIGLLSPYRELMYLLGLTLTTIEPPNARPFGEDDWKKSKELLERIYSAYAWMYWPTADEVDHLNEEWRKPREVAMPAFLHYFNSGLMASTEQVRDRIVRYVVPFDPIVEGLFGISAGEMLAAADAIGKRLQNDLNELRRLGETEKTERLAFLDLAEKNQWTLERTRVEAQRSPCKPAVEAYLEALKRVFKTDLCQLSNEIGENLALPFWKAYSSKRGTVKEPKYPTDHNPAEAKPLILLANTEAMVPSVHSIFTAILNTAELALMRSEERDMYLQRRDEVLEQEAARILADFFGSDACIFTSVYESINLQHEHDVVIVWGRRVFVVEAKASPPREPLRDPEKAYVRIRDDFRSKRGIQKAYEQAHRIEDAIARGEVVRLHNSQRHEILTLSRETVDRVYCLCITRDNFGMIATDLSLLLEKKLEDPYPWAANVADLENLFDAFKYFGWKADRFCEYLEGRERLHGKASAEDELEFAGYLIAHGNFDRMLQANHEHTMLNPTYSEVFDEIRNARRGGPPVQYNPSPPVVKNLSKEIRRWNAESAPPTATTPRTVPKQGRNEKCACGSGKKYKRCHGK